MPISFIYTVCQVYNFSVYSYSYLKYYEISLIYKISVPNIYVSLTTVSSVHVFGGKFEMALAGGVGV
jgi:hypothetical protein